MSHKQLNSNRNRFRTSEVAEKVGIHPNTLRWYEASGLLSPLQRTPAGYRIFTPRSVVEAKIVRRATRVTWMSGRVRATALGILALVRKGDLSAARKLTGELINYIAWEIRLAQEALNVIAAWIGKNGGFTDTNHSLMEIKQAADRTGTTADQIRNWERNALLVLPRNPANGYRLFGVEDVARIKVIRFCRLAGYSLTAIRRLMQAVDAVPDGTVPDLVSAADIPLPEEAGFETFPTDTWLTTLDNHRRAIVGILPLLTVLETLQ